jgi:transcriptional regulator with XRE-family HTH domain
MTDQMTSDSLRALMGSLQLRQQDVAYLTGVGTRTVRNWLAGTHGIPISAQLVLRAHAAGLFTRAWLTRQLGTPPPRARAPRA